MAAAAPPINSVKPLLKAVKAAFDKVEAEIDKEYAPGHRYTRKLECSGAASSLQKAIDQVDEHKECQARTLAIAIASTEIALAELSSVTKEPVVARRQVLYKALARLRKQSRSCVDVVHQREAAKRKLIAFLYECRDAFDNTMKKVDEVEQTDETKRARKKELTDSEIKNYADRIIHNIKKKDMLSARSFASLYARLKAQHAFLARSGMSESASDFEELAKRLNAMWSAIYLVANTDDDENVVEAIHFSDNEESDDDVADVVKGVGKVKIDGEE